jgi:hypothetical protein
MLPIFSAALSLFAGRIASAQTNKSVLKIIVNLSGVKQGKVYLHNVYKNILKLPVDVSLDTAHITKTQLLLIRKIRTCLRFTNTSVA